MQVAQTYTSLPHHHTQMNDIEQASLLLKFKKAYLSSQSASTADSCKSYEFQMSTSSTTTQSPTEQNVKTAKKKTSQPKLMFKVNKLSKTKAIKKSKSQVASKVNNNVKMP